MNVVLLGPPGAGKGTQARRLSENFGWVQVSAGDLLRKARQEKTSLGLKAESFMKAGQLVPNELVIDMIRERLAEGDCEAGCILDGFPRNVAQALSLDQMMTSLKRHIDRVVNVQVDSEELVKRLAARRQCRQCGENYHLSFHPSKAAGICDRCGGELFQRDDDKEVVIRKRLDVYEKETFPVVAYYREKGLLQEVKGTGEIEAIYDELVKAVS